VTRARAGWRGRALVVAVPYLWLALFFVVPFLIVLKISLATSVVANPPYTKLFEHGRLQAGLDSYGFLLSDDLYALAYLNSLKTASIACLCCLLIGYPMAYGIARARPERRGALLMLVILPFWTSFLIRVYAWVTLLQTTGPVNRVLTGTRTPPALSVPSAASTHSQLLGAQSATRSPGWTPAAISAAAIAVTRSPSSR